MIRGIDHLLECLKTIGPAAELGAPFGFGSLAHNSDVYFLSETRFTFFPLGIPAARFCTILFPVLDNILLIFDVSVNSNRH